MKTIQPSVVSSDQTIAPSSAANQAEETQARPLSIDDSFFSKIVTSIADSLPHAAGIAPKAAVSPYVSGVTAGAYFVGDVSTGKVYLTKNPDTVLPVASMSKLITAIAATDTLSPKVSDQNHSRRGLCACGRQRHTRRRDFHDVRALVSAVAGFFKRGRRSAGIHDESRRIH